jgi:hypothetical protein
MYGVFSVSASGLSFALAVLNVRQLATSLSLSLSLSKSLYLLVSSLLSQSLLFQPHLSQSRAYHTRPESQKALSESLYLLVS